MAVNRAQVVAAQRLASARPWEPISEPATTLAMQTALASWTLRRALRSPVAWLTLAVSAAAFPLLELLSPIGLTTRGERPGAWLGEVLTATALVGAVFALEGLAGARDLFARHRAAGPSAAGWTIAIGIFIFTLPSLLLGLFFASASFEVPWRILASACLGATHVAALAWLLALLPIPDGVRSIALVFLAWLVPGWIPTESLPTAALVAMVDVSRPGRIDLSAATWSARIALLAPIIVLVGACLTIRPAQHSP